jgi:hypothetical protein
MLDRRGESLGSTLRNGCSRSRDLKSVAQNLHNVDFHRADMTALGGAIRSRTEPATAPIFLRMSASGPRAKSLDSSLMSAITGETDSLAKMLDRCALTLKRHQRFGNWTEMYAA